MEKKETEKIIVARRKRILNKGLGMNLLLLLPPLVLEGVILIASPVLFFLPLFLTYFVLPMFYTVERRIRNNISGIGNQNFTYVDGYKAFFASAQGGIFGVILAFFSAVMLTLFLFLILGFTFPYICTNYAGAYNTYQELVKMYGDTSTDTQTVLNYLLANGPVLMQPMTIFMGALLFLPCFYLVFISINFHLTDHYLCTIVLPDIDLNISASQARALSRGSFRRLLFGERIGYDIRYNWPFYLGYAVLYGISVYFFSLVSVSSANLMAFVALATPVISLFYGLFFDYFCLSNDYAILEGIAPLLLERIPLPMRTSILQTYNNPNYIHGQESAIRGSFVPQNSFREEHPFASPFASSPTAAPTSETKPEDEPTGAVIDLSQSADDTKPSSEDGKDKDSK